MSDEVICQVPEDKMQELITHVRFLMRMPAPQVPYNRLRHGLTELELLDIATDIIELRMEHAKAIYEIVKVWDWESKDA